MPVTREAVPRLSIGLPVYNGGDYVGLAIQSILAQTFTDFELIISDNASTDGTRRICEDFARRDKRVRYHRNEENIGATQNWYLVHRLSRAGYFASVAHDDLYEPTYMERCIEVLDRDPSIVVCHTKTKLIDERGNPSGVFDVEVGTTSTSAADRLYRIIRYDYLCIQLYGVMRSEALAATKVFAGYYGCDRNLLAELALIGRIVEVPEYLFLHRIYAGSLGSIVNSGKSESEMRSIDPGTNWDNTSTQWRIFWHYAGSVGRHVSSPLERLRCYGVLLRLLAGRVKGRVDRLLLARAS